MIRRPPRSTLDRSSAASDVYKRQNAGGTLNVNNNKLKLTADISSDTAYVEFHAWYELSLIHISEPTRPY